MELVKNAAPVELLAKVPHSSSELDSSVPGPQHVEFSGLWVVIHHLEELVFL